MLSRGLKILAQTTGIAFMLWLLAAVGLGGFVYATGRVDQAEPSDVIVVLGSGLRRDGSPGPSLYRRTAKAADLYHEGIAPSLICTGGFTAGQIRSEAAACADLLVERGVPASAIVLEESSRSTLENAIHTREIMAARVWDTAVVVSDGYHLLRAEWIFRDQGLSVVMSPADSDPPPYSLLVALAREVAALHLQALISLFNLPITYVPVF